MSKNKRHRVALEEIKAIAEQYLVDGSDSQIAQDVATLMVELASAALAVEDDQGE